MNTDDFRFKKKYGQNFLRDDSIPNKIVSKSNILDESLVIEIGPGAGILTKKLAEVAKYVIAYEIDESLRPVLEENLTGISNVKVIFGDFLEQKVVDDLKEYSYKHLYIVANLPYYITTPILLKIIDMNLDIERVIVMVQKEVGDRFSAKPGSKDYGSITVLLNSYFDVSKLFDVGRNCFIPKPNVDSMMLALDKKDTLIDIKDRNVFTKLVRDSFQFKRKTLRNNLKAYDLDTISRVLSKYNLDLNVRAENLSVDIFCDISNNLV